MGEILEGRVGVSNTGRKRENQKEKQAEEKKKESSKDL